MKALKRILCLALCLTITILGLSFMAPKADALALTVGLGIVVAALAAGGLTYLVTSGGSSALTEAVSNNVEDWLEDSGNVVDFPTPNDFFEFLGDPDNQDGPSMNDGRVLIGAASAHLLINFLVWLKDHLGLESPEDEPVLVYSNYALPINGGYLHLSTASYDSFASVSAIGDTFDATQYPQNAETILFTFSEGNYVGIRRFSGNDYTFAVYVKSSGFSYSPVITPNSSTNPNRPFTFVYPATGSYAGRFGCLTQNISNNVLQDTWAFRFLTVSESEDLLNGIVATSSQVSAGLEVDPSIIPDEFQYGDLLELELISDEDPADLNEWGELVIQEATDGTLDISAEQTTGPEQLEYPDTILGWLQWIWEALANTRLSNIIQEIRNLPGRFESWFTQIITWLGNLPGTLTNLFNDLKTAIQALPQQIANAVSAAFALDPALAAEIGDTWNGKFGWIDDIKDWFDTVTALEPEPPVIYIHLEDADSNYGYSYGGREVALDLHWYSAYKSDVDALISGFLWLGFLWLVFKRTADIINGVGMADREAHDIVEIRDEEGHSSLFRRRRR